MNKPTAQQFLLLSKATPQVRYAFFNDEANFYAFWLYYFKNNFVHPLAEFHFKWLEELE